MPVIKGLVTQEGSLIKVSIGWSHARIRRLRLAGRPVPSRLEAMALDLPYLGPVLANAPAFQEIEIASQYDASLTILHPSARAQLTIKQLSVLELPIGLLGYQVVIGRDLLSRCMFLYNGIGSRFTLKY